MVVELSPAALLALCGLVRDALDEESDAAPLLARVAAELAAALAGEGLPPELAEQPQRVEALKRAGFLRAV